MVRRMEREEETVCATRSVRGRLSKREKIRGRENERQID